MKCDFCDNKAKVFFTQVVNGTMKKVALCDACAEERGVTDPESLLMSEQLLAPPTPDEVDLPPPETLQEIMGQAAKVGAEVPNALPTFAVTGAERCPSCDFTLETYQKVGRLGCPDCYQTYRGLLSKRLGKIHRGHVHKGRVPKGMVEQERLKSLLKDLAEKLEAAIEQEDYEAAADLRDQISQIEKQEAKRRSKEVQG